MINRLSGILGMVTLFVIIITTEKVIAYPIIKDILRKVSENNIKRYISDLENFKTRNSYTIGNSLPSGGRDASQYIFDEFRTRLGLKEVEFHSYHDHFTKNVVATLEGKKRKDEIYIICAHYDSTSGRPLKAEENAPGADDNASGSAAVLEAARVLKDYEFESTIKFILFSGEEQGLIGSKAYVDASHFRKDNIKGVLNFDMIGYSNENPPENEDLDVIGNNKSNWLVDSFIKTANLYVPQLNTKKGNNLRGMSDHNSFWYKGYDAILGIEDVDVPNPYYHSIRDTLSTLYLPFTTKVTQSAVASLTNLATLYNPRKYPLENPEWSIDLDEYGRSQRLMYPIPNTYPRKYRNEMYDWAGYVRYTPQGQSSVAGWLYDTAIFPNAAWIDTDPGGSGYLGKFGNMDKIENVQGIVSQVSNDDLRITIQSWIDDWLFREQPGHTGIKKYTLKQNYVFENIDTNNLTLTDLKYIQYMDADMTDNDYGYPVRHELPFTAEPRSRASEMWILEQPGQSRGYSLACRENPQPDPYYGRNEGWGVGLYSDIKEAIENDGLSSVIRPVGAYYKGDAAAALRWSIGSLASGEKKDIALGLYVVPEPCTILLLGTGLAGLAGRRFVIRRKRGSK